MCLGSVAVIAPVFAPISRSRKLFSCRCRVLRRKPDPWPHIHPGLGESIAECVVVVEAWRDPRPPGGRRHLHWQLVSAHSVIGTDSWPDTTESWRKTRPSRETHRVETKPGVRPIGDYSVFQ